MAKLVWDQVSQHLYETGVVHVVIYKRTGPDKWNGSAWNGVTGIDDSPEGAEANEQYADNILYLNLISAEKWKGTIKAFTYPEEFNECMGARSLIKGVYAGQQTHKRFGLSYRTIIGNDIDGNEFGYALHIVYNCTAAPSEQSHNTVNDSPEATEFSWALSSIPVHVTGLTAPTSTLVIKSTEVDAAKLTAIESILYGEDATSTGDAGVEPRLPLPDEIIQIMNAAG